MPVIVQDQPIVFYKINKEFRYPFGSGTITGPAFTRWDRNNQQEQFAGTAFTGTLINIRLQDITKQNSQEGTQYTIQNLNLYFSTKKGQEEKKEVVTINFSFNLARTIISKLLDAKTFDLLIFQLGRFNRKDPNTGESRLIDFCTINEKVAGVNCPLAPKIVSFTSAQYHDSRDVIVLPAKRWVKKTKNGYEPTTDYNQATPFDPTTKAKMVDPTWQQEVDQIYKQQIEVLAERIKKYHAANQPNHPTQPDQLDQSSRLRQLDNAGQSTLEDSQINETPEIPFF
jgi:hypothetical protein